MAVYMSCGRPKVDATRHLRKIISAAKRVWAHDFLHHTTTENLWEVAAWRKGRSIKHIPPILSGPSATPMHNPLEMTEAFRKCFFVTDQPVISPDQPDDPAPLPVRDFVPISEDEIAAALSKTSNKSAPGISGINYKLLKWAFQACPDRFHEIFNAAISLGYHPWKEAVVVVIPKPLKPDYRLPKAYRPISLLECCGKLLEKIITKHILLDAHSFDILLPNQFGSHDYHSAVDAALCLVHQAQAAVKGRFVVSVILFDIQGFFNNLNIECAVHIFRNLGFPRPLCDWIHSFLSNRQVCLSFNGFKSDPIALDHGTPQGSPLSPILSAIFTSPLLKLINASWVRRGMNMYVDDGAIFCIRNSHIISAQAAVQGFNEIARWLSRNGLRTDPDKTEFISFFPPCAAHIGSRVTEIALMDPFSGCYPVKRSDLIRYLGIFIHYKFNWSHHVTIMANQARSTVCALNVLGNSVRGLDYANWRRLFHALTIPILSYGFPLYANDPAIKGLVNTLQIAQNEMVRKMSGCFKTAPVIPLHYLIAIPPFSLTLKKLSCTFTDRISHLPPNSLLCTLLSANPVAAWHMTLNPSTALTCAFPTSLQPFTYPAHPSLPTWTNYRVRDNTVIKPNHETADFTKSLISQPPHDTFHLFVQILNTPSPPFTAAFLLYKGGRLVHSGTSSCSS